MSITSFDLACSSVATRIRMKYIMRYFANKSYTNVLECGCGEGVFINFFSKISFRLISFDLSTSIIKKLKKRFPDNELHVCDLTNMPYVDKCFDLVFAIDVIEHTNQSEIALAEINRVIKDNGLLALSVPSIKWDYILTLIRGGRSDFGHYDQYKKEEILALLRKTGFEIIYFEEMQELICALYEGLLVKCASSFYGSDAVAGHRLAEIVEKSSLKSVVYILINKLLYPIFILLEMLIPPKLMFNYFFILKKN